jgi:hypothetical protein
VEGVFTVGLQPAAGVTLNINSNAIHSYGQGQPHIFTTHRTTTGAGGSFVFERVLPGKARLGRRILLMVDDGATEVTSSKMVPIDPAAGETTRVDLGGVGRAIIGRLAPPVNYKEKVLWNFALIHARAHLPQLKSPPVPADARNDNEKYRDWWKRWIETDDGKAWSKASQENQLLRERSPYFTASVARDGTFRIDDVSAGNYRLSVRFSEHPAGQLLNYDFSIPAADDVNASQPVDLGVLTLKKVSQR